MTAPDLTPEQDEHLHAPVDGQLEVPVEDQPEQLSLMALSR